MPAIPAIPAPWRGHNEPGDVFAGAIWALLAHPALRQIVRNGGASWLQVFQEYTRWVSPIGVGPRRIAKDAWINGVRFHVDDRAFLMFSSANRDEDVFGNADVFDVQRDTGAAIAFGAGSHFCAGARAARAMIADVALPMAFARLRNLRLSAGPIPRQLAGPLVA